MKLQMILVLVLLLAWGVWMTAPVSSQAVATSPATLDSSHAPKALPAPAPKTASKPNDPRL
jgi:multisubunit Na+/H+ antiporter MnhG subunit